MNSLVMATCEISPDSVSKIPTLKDGHLSYIRSQMKLIAYAGIIETTEQPYQQIIYFLKTSDLESARNFVEADPYFICFNRVKYSPFTQRIPGL